jgi:eukaryotic-like serine/threonine-protein kinase
MAVEGVGVAGRYRLGRSVGAGGMGRVWLARDEFLGREVAIKEVALPFGLSDNERLELRQRTLREARAAARMNHPNVVKIYDVVDGDGGPWIVMEYVQSRSLLEILREDGPLPVREVARIGLDLLSALNAANRVGVLHRDIKPGNVLIGENGRVVLTDFGSAIYEGTEGAAITQTGVVLGSPQYIAPERARSGVSTAESDLWSLGATLYAAVEGRPPYHRETPMGTLIALATERPDPPVHAGPLKPVVTGLLRKNPRNRMNAEELERRLRKIAGERRPVSLPRLPLPRSAHAGESVNDRSSAPPDRAVGSAPVAESSPAGRRWPSWRWAAAAALVVVLAVAGAVLIQRNESPDRSTGQPPAGRDSTASSAASPALPAGFGWWQDPSGFRVAVPVGWDMARESAAVMLFSDPDAPMTLRVHSLTGTDQDPAAALGSDQTQPALPGYRRIRIEPLPQGPGTEEWEYTFDGPSGRMHGLERLFVVGGRGFVIQWRTPDAEWRANLARFTVIVNSFRASPSR